MHPFCQVLSPQLTFGLFAMGCVAALSFVQCCLPETKGALGSHDPHAPHSPHASTALAAGHELHVGPPTCRALMGDSEGGASGRTSDCPSVDSDDVEWSGAVRSSVDARARRPLAMH